MLIDGSKGHGVDDSKMCMCACDIHTPQWCTAIRTRATIMDIYHVHRIKYNFFFRPAAYYFLIKIKKYFLYKYFLDNI